MKFQKWALEVKVFGINREFQKQMKRCSLSPVSTKGERERLVCCKSFEDRYDKVLI